MMKKVMLIIVLVAAMFSNNAFAQVERVQALFVYNFSRYIAWPESTNSSEFVISVLGEKEMFDEISKVSKDKTVGRQKMVIKYCQNINEIGASQILVVGSKFKNIDAIKAALKSGNTLLITDIYSSSKGADIAFKMDDDKMKFQMSRKNIKEKGLNVDSRLSDMAVLLD